MQEGGHAFPFLETFLEFEHLVLEDADLFRDENEFGIATSFRVVSGGDEVVPTF